MLTTMEQLIDLHIDNLVIALLQTALYTEPDEVYDDSLVWDSLKVFMDGRIKFKLSKDIWVNYNVRQVNSSYVKDVVKKLVDRIFTKDDV